MHLFVRVSQVEREQTQVRRVGIIISRNELSLPLRVDDTAGDECFTGGRVIVKRQDLQPVVIAIPEIEIVLGAKIPDGGGIGQKSKGISKSAGCRGIQSYLVAIYQSQR